MKTIFLAVTGTQGSGKSVFTEIAKEKYNIPSYRLGDIIIEECKKRGLEINGRNMGKMAIVLRHDFGPQAIAIKALPAIKEFTKNKPKMIIIDGVRSVAELAVFKEAFESVKLVAIIAPFEIRRERVEKRKRIDSGFSGDFEEREQRELSFGIGDVITKADYFIMNDIITKEKFIEEIESLLTTILKE